MGANVNVNVLTAFNAISAPNLNALQRRAIQLRRWHEWTQNEENEREESEGESDRRTRVGRDGGVKFSRQTRFMSAVKENDFDELRKLTAEMKSDIDEVKLSDGTTALHHACVDGNREMVEWLIANGAAVNVADNERWTPLHVCANAGNRALMELLLRCGADANAITSDGEMAVDLLDGGGGGDEEAEAERMLMRAMRSGRRMCVNVNCVDVANNVSDSDDSDDSDDRLRREMREQELAAIERDVDEWIARGTIGRVDGTVDAVTGATVVHVCAAKGYATTLERILRSFAHELDLEARDNDGWSALHAAAYWNQSECFEILVNRGANIDAKVNGMSSVELSGDNERIAQIVADRRRQLLTQSQTTNQTRIEGQLQPIEAQSTQTVSSQSVALSLSPSTSSLLSSDSRLSSSSELQRKVNAKKARESRRSTQGVQSEDIEKAKRLIETVDSNESIESEGNVDDDDDSAKGEQNENESNTNSSNSDNFIISSQRRRRPDVRKRRSTGIEVETDDIDNNNCESPSVGEGDANVVSVVSRSRSTSASRQSSTSLNSTTTSADEDDDKDYKKLYEQLRGEHANCDRECERLRAQLSACEESERRREQEMQRERRKFDRRLSELEEELKAMNAIRAENARLKDENAALIRVISKLSK